MDPSGVKSGVCFEQPKEWVRERIQFSGQELLEDEVRQLLRQRKNRRRRAVDVPAGYGNDFGNERRLSLSCGTIKLLNKLTQEEAA